VKTFNKVVIVFSAFFIIVGFSIQSAWAISSPEPQSGGRFFSGKGTKSSAVYSYENSVDDTYMQKSDARSSFDEHHYGKGLNLGILHVEPSLGYTGEWDSNIFLEEKNTDGDYINRLTGGLDAYLPMLDGKYLLFAGVQSRSEWFVDHSNESHTDWSYQAGGEINFNAFQIKVDDVFKDTTDRSDSELTQRVKRYENILKGLVTVPFGRFFSETEVNDHIIHFREAGFDQFNLNAFSIYPRLGFDVGPRTQALVEYGYYHAHYENLSDRDGDAHQGQVGLRGFLGSGDLVSYQLWGGWQFRNYDNGSLAGFSSFVGHGELVYNPTELSQFILRGARRPEESLSANQTFYTRNEVSLRYRRQVAQQWFVNAQGGVGLNHYPNNRIDFIWEPGAGVEYVLPGNIMALFTEYRFSQRLSDVSGSDYNRHLIDFGIKAEV